jgi:methylthioribose-1-phosphate isomerase
MAIVGTADLRPLYWRNGRVELLDQTRLPHEEVWLEISDYRVVISAIQEMRIRGAPAIGIAGAYAVALAASELSHLKTDEFLRRLELAAKSIQEARPTGANLAWAVRRMIDFARRAKSPEEALDGLVVEAERIHREDIEANRAMGSHGAALLPEGGSVLTHCNAGALATGGYGTSLGVIKAAWAEGRVSHVYATETRPLLQGSRLTAWELVREGIDATVLPDSAAGQLMRRGRVQSVILGADRIAANGDVANKIGTYSLAVLAKENGVPFYVAAPTSTVDLSIRDGDSIPIEERDPGEVTHIGGARLAAEGIEALNVAFDVTPNEYVTAIVTEAGVARPPFDGALAAAVGSSNG